MTGELRMDEARELGHEDSFLKWAVEESILHIVLSNGPLAVDS